GCPFACKNCIVPESWDEQGGEVGGVVELAAWVLAQAGIEGVTFSGGEPMAQAGALAGLGGWLREKAGLGGGCSTGYTLEHLQERGTSEQQALLARTDLLIDGVYIEAQHADRLWRGSANQRLLPLTARYRDLIETLPESEDCSAGLEFFVTEAGSLAFA